MNANPQRDADVSELAAESGDWVTGAEATALRVQFHRMRQLLKGLPGADRVPEQVEADILGCSVDVLRDTRARLRRAVRSTVDDLSADVSTARGLATVRSRYAGAVIVCMGDSITADHQSWAEMLAVALAPHVRVVNEGRSGDTSTDLLSRFSASVPPHRPDVVLIFAGTNDARSYQAGSGQPAVSDEESERNFAELARLTGGLGADLAWITPAGIDDRRVRSHPNTTGSGAVWTNSAIARKADVLRRRPEPVADLQAVFAAAGDADLLLPDGLHPALAGQILIYQAAVELLRRMAQPH